MPRSVVAWGVVTSPLALLSLLLLIDGVTFEGRLAAVCALLCVIAPGLAIARRRRAALASLALLLVCGVTLVARAPSGSPTEGATTRAVYLLGGGASRLAPTNLVPEVDQLALATWLVWIPDPVMNFASATRLRAAIRSAYARGREDAEAGALGSAMGDAITNRDTGRMFVYEPPHAPGERRPAMLFLHGSAGSWKGYFLGQRALAARRRMGLAQPSFGFGNWNRPGGLASIERARRWLASQPWVDPAQIYLVCLSNGGRGVTRVIRSGPSRYRGVAFISAVVEPDVLEEAPLDPSWAGTPALVLHGVRDDRIPLDYADDGVRTLRGSGFAVRYITLPEEDHYLIFTAHDRMERELSSWFDLVERSAQPPR